MAEALDSGQLATQRTQRQWSKGYLALPEYHTIYTARLASLPASNDMVAQISVNTESGTRANVLADMALYIGSTAGAYDLGICRIRKTPIAGTFYLAETSEVVWTSGCYLTVVDDYQIWAKPLRIVSEVPFMDWDIPYSDQHDSFDPVPVMGSDKVAKLVNGSVDVLLGASTDVPAWVIDSTITARLWTISGAVSIDDNTAVNPTASFDTAGTYLAYCRFTAANGKQFTGIRYIIIWDEDHPLIKNFQISNGKINQETGSCSFEVTLFSNFSRSSLRERSKVILCAEDFGENLPITLPGQIEGSENIVCVGWISDIDTSRESEFGEISFAVESAEYWMKKIRDYPSGLELVAGDAAAWTQMPLLTVDRAIWHFLHWRTTVTRVMDVTLTGDLLYSSRFNIARSNIWERVEQVSRPTIHAIQGVDKFGRFFVSIEPQMVPEDDRTWPTVMTFTDSDIENGITWRRRDVPSLAMLFYSGIAVSETGGASSYFSMSPGHSYAHYGEEEAQDNYLVADQEDSNEKCGLYYGWKNNQIDNLEVNFVHSMRVLDCWPRQKYHFEVSADDDPRGIGFEEDFIPREISFTMDETSGFISYNVLFEPESAAGPAINGDVPTMEDIDFSYPNPLPKIPPLLLPLTLPYTYPDPTEETGALPKKIVIGTTLGVLYTLNADEDDITLIKWQFMNNGLSSNDISQIGQLVVTAGGALYLMCDGSASTGYLHVMRASALGAAWVEVFRPANRVYAAVSRTPRVIAIGVNTSANDEIGIVDTVDYIFFQSTSTGLFSYGNTSFSTGSFLATRHITSLGDLAYMGGKWFLHHVTPVGIGGSLSEPTIYRLSASGTFETQASVATGPGQGLGDYRILSRAGKLFIWVEQGNQDGYQIGDSSLTFTNYPSGTYAMNPEGYMGVALSPSGNVGMGAHSAGPWTPKLSTDAFASWASVAGVIPIGSDVWENCRDDFRFLFGGGSTGPRFTPDQGSTYIELAGNLTIIAAARDITHIRFIE